MKIHLTSEIIKKASIVHAFDVKMGVIHLVIGDRDGAPLCEETQGGDRWFYGKKITSEVVDGRHRCCFECVEKVKKYKVKYAD